MGGHLRYNDLGDSASPPEEVVFRLRPEDEELVQRPGMGKENAELLEQYMQGPEVGDG